MTPFAFVVLALVAGANAHSLRLAFDSSLDDVWTSFKATHGKVYESSTEENVRRLIFEKNVRYINQHNLEHDLGQHTFTLGINQFADLTHEEFKSLYLHPITVKQSGSTFLPPSNVVYPASVDWRTQGYVTPVKDQGQCGSCWAFSTTGSLEGQWFKKTGKLIPLSEQQLVDCSQSFGNNGCGGGLMDYAFAYIKQYGEESEDDYPYTAQDGTCNYDATKVVANDTGYTDVRSGSESDLLAAVATVGPISVAIDANHESFQFYKSGVYNERSCSSKQLDHGVLAVGYGTQGGSDYWIVKNSWNTVWGMKGYILMSRNKANQCGIATMASYPLV